MHEQLIDDLSRRALLDTLLMHAPVGLAFVNRELRYVWLNDALAANTGLPAADMVGRRVADMVPGLWPQLQAPYALALNGTSVSNVRIHGTVSAARPDQRVWLVSHYPVRRGADIIGVGVMVHDITDHTRVERALRVRTDLYAMLSRTNRAVSRCHSTEELFAELCTIAVDVGRFRFAWIGVPMGDRLVVAARAGEDRGYLDELVISLDPADPRSQGPTGRAARLGETIVVNDFMSATLTALWHDRATRSGFAASAAFPLFEGGKVVAVLTLYAATPDFFTDDLVTTLGEITPSVSFALDAMVQERERRLRENELRLRDRAIAALTQGIVIADATRAERPIVYASPGFLALTGYAEHEVLGRSCRFLQGRDTDAATVAQLRDALDRGVPCTVQLLNYRKDGTAFWNSLAVSPVFDEAGALTHFVGIQTDVTDRRRADAAAVQSQKMEALGRLAGGVAHDFNNLLTVITGYSDLAMLELAPADPRRESLEEIRKASEHASQLTRQLLTFSRQQPFHPRLVNLNDVVQDTVAMLRRLLGSDITLHCTLGDDTGLVRADPSQLTQLLLNIAVNARDAMPDGGELFIDTLRQREADIDSSGPDSSDPSLPDTTDTPPVAPDGYAVLRVRDTGSGMDDATLARVFEPFFTTKGVGKGTGLGLATVHGIVTQLHGRIRVTSDVGRGTTFTVMLPSVSA
jgi:PAS domain S-box-containing protein